jgi:hypothetical protein
MERGITDATIGLWDTDRSDFGAVASLLYLSVIFYVAARWETTGPVEFCCVREERFCGV